MKSAGKRLRLDQYLVEQGYYESPRDALGPIMAGQVVVDGAVVAKPGTAVRAGAEIFIRGRKLRFASRGGYKLERALERFAVDVTGRVVLDAGASTGGFTDCLLLAGCSKVYAVDVGYGQLRGRLAADDRVVNLERMNISSLTRDLVPGVEFCTVDLAYLSLLQAIPILRQLCGRVEMICLVKPLYEGLPEAAKNRPDAIRPVLQALLAELAGIGHGVSDLTPSPLIGGRGALEFLILLRGDPGAEAPADLVERAMAELDRNPPVEEVP